MLLSVVQAKTPKPLGLAAKRISSRVASFDHDRHAVQLATRGPTAGQPKRIKPTASCQVTPAQMANAKNAWEFAITRGIRLNTWVTIIFDQLKGDKGWKAGASPGDQVRFQRQRTRRCVSDWCRRKGTPEAWISVVENVAGRGPHLHMLLHLPEGAPPATMRVEGISYTEDATWRRHRNGLHSFLVGFSGYSPAQFDAMPAGRRPVDICNYHLPDKTLANRNSAETKLRYLMKSVSPNFIVKDDRKKATILEVSSQGTSEPNVTLYPSTNTYTKRMLTTSFSVGKQARKANDFVDEPFSAKWLSRKLHFDQFRKEALVLLKDGMTQPFTSETHPILIT